MSDTRKDRKKLKHALDDVRLPLPVKTGGIHRVKTVYKRKPRTLRAADYE